VLLASALDGGNWSVSLPDRFTSGIKVRDTRRTGSWVGPRAGLDTMAKKYPRTFPAENRTPVTQPVA